MSRLNEFWRRITNLFRRARFDRELSEEMRLHREMRERELQEYEGTKTNDGLKADEARYAAQRRFGNELKLREESRDMWGWRWFEDLVQDVRFGARVLRKSPGFTSVAILTLALGIGANTTTFTLLNCLLLRQPPVSHPEELVGIRWMDQQGEKNDLSFPLFEAVEQRQSVFSKMFVWWGGAVDNVEVRGTLTQGEIWAVSGNFYSELGVQPYLGRLLDDADVGLHGSGPAHVAVVGYQIWQDRFGGDPGIVGQTVAVEGVPFTIVGITRKGFTALGTVTEPSVTIPLTAEPILYGFPPERIYANLNSWLSAGGRLKPGITLTKARAEIEALWPSALATTVPPKYSERQKSEYLARRVNVGSLTDSEDGWLKKRFSQPLRVLMIIAGLVVLLACVNLASLMLARAAARSHEVSTRMALGASRWRLARQFLTESLLLSVAGAGAGLLIASWASAWLRDLMMQTYIIPTALNVSPDLRMLGFTTAAALATGILFGLAPALQASRKYARQGLGRTGRTVSSGTSRFGKSLVTAQVALSLVLVMVAALFARTLQNLHKADPGFRTKNILIADLFPRPGGYKNLNNDKYYPELVRRIANLPGVRQASMSHTRPLTDITGNDRVAPSWAAPGTSEGTADLQMVTPNYFSTMGIAFIRGRDFRWDETAKTPRVAILGKTVAQQLFPSGDAMGHHIRIGTEKEQQEVEVVGIVGDASLWNLRRQHSPEVYIPLLQGYSEWSNILLWTDDVAGTLKAVRREVDAMGREYVFSAPTLELQSERSILEERVSAMLSSFFGALGLLIAAIGLFGLMSYTVMRRRREIGIRMAVGAQPRDILRMVLGETLLLVGLGILIGVPCALAGSAVIARMLFGLSPYDTATLASAACVLAAAGLLAGYLPARKASRLDPMTVLRSE